MSHPFIVEFTGPPGVGKSSLYKAVTRRGGLSFFRPSSTLQGWLYGRSLRHQLARLAVHEPSFSATHEKLLKRKLEALESTATTLYRRCWMLSNAVQKLLADVRMLSDHSGNRYLIEEGLCHGFSAALNDDEGITLMSRHRGFVFIEPDELGTVVRRLQMRGGVCPFMRAWTRPHCGR